jgi:hypothetical protein
LPCISALKSSSAEAGRKPRERFLDGAPALAAGTSSAGIHSGKETPIVRPRLAII